MGMMEERLAPGMEDGNEADRRPEMARVRGNRSERGGRGPKEQRVEEALILEGDGRHVVRHGEHDVKILAVEDLGLPALDPLCARQRLTLGTVPIRAGVIRDALMAAGVALFDMPAEHSRTTRLDCGHHAPLG